MANRLADALSPYLLAHADNPVDWWPWCAEAFELARRRDVPVLLSVGYAACHWCHVMAHESFEDEATAAYLNEHFVAIKVDREERPDIDAIYMAATVATTGSGGWPMTVFLTPEAEPFHCGTYFPVRPTGGMPSFRTVLEAVERTWRERPAEVRAAGAQLAAAVAASLEGPETQPGKGSEPPGAELLDAAARSLEEQADRAYGGFGGAPKFPPSMALEFLLRRAARVGRDAGLELAERTLTAMARGGIYDQLGGGFARYAVDARWVVPHFEKMLYDNALLLRAYLHAFRLTGSTAYARVARETATFLLRELRTPEGGFAASLDADSDGAEGRYYVWTPTELATALGDADAALAAEFFGVTTAGTFEGGASTLQRVREPASQDEAEAYDRIRARLFAARAARVRPARDDKVVAAWNGFAITALAEAGELLAEPAYSRAAVEAAELLATLHTPEPGRLLRVSRDGRAGPAAGVLEDFAAVAEAYLCLLGTTGEPIWLERAGSLLDAILARFAIGNEAGGERGGESGGERGGESGGEAEGGLFDTASDAEPLVSRPRDPADGATPAGCWLAAGSLLAYASITGSARHRRAAENALTAGGLLERLAIRAPRAVGWGLAVAEAWLAGPLEVAVVGPGEGYAALRAAAFASTSAGAVVVASEHGSTNDGADRSAAEPIPLLAGRTPLEGRAAAYVCRGFVCERPVTQRRDLDERIGSWRESDPGSAPSACGWASASRP